jgi:hypothetical protein
MGSSDRQGGAAHVELAGLLPWLLVQCGYEVTALSTHGHFGLLIMRIRLPINQGASFEYFDC